MHAENERTGRQITSDWILNTRFKFCFLRSLRGEELFFFFAWVFRTQSGGILFHLAG